MVVGPAAPIRSVNNGEFDPGAHGRVDVKQWYSAGKLFKGVEPVPQSGWRLMGGTRNIGAVRGKLQSVLTIDAGDIITGPHTATVEVFTSVYAGDLSAAFFDDLKVSVGTATVWLEIQTVDGWQQLSHATEVDTAGTSWLVATKPQTPLTSTNIKIMATFSESATIEFAGMNLFLENAEQVTPRYVSLSPDSGIKYSGFVSHGIADFFTSEGYHSSAYIPDITEDRVSDLDFYAEADTIGIFLARSSIPSKRLLLINDNTWVVDDWPYTDIPEVDLGGDYEKTADVWEITVQWTGDIAMRMSFTVDGDSTPSVEHQNSGGATVTSNNFSTATWNNFASDLKDAIEALPNMKTGVTVVATDLPAGAKELTVTFGGENIGAEYEVSVLITNTSDASALPNHTTVGETAGEPLFSETRGYPNIVELVQDRIGYGGIPAKTGALQLSATGEYFDLNIESQSDSAARLDNIRAQISEAILSIKESKYLIVFTDKATYYATNRTITSGEPLNFVKTSETGIRKNTKAVDLDGYVFYISNNGEQLMSLKYDDVATSYLDNIESLLASHLISSIDRDVRQVAEREQDAAKMWMMRSDGRLIAGQVIKNQDITGFCEWRCADDGAVREIGIDGENKLWMTCQRGSQKFYELYDQDLLLQNAVELTCDLTGEVADLDYLEGATVWATVNDYVIGPLVVTNGVINLGDYYEGSIMVGRWIPPWFETMPQPLIGRNDEMIFRPGRIHTVHANIIDTTSVAIGANGQTPKNVVLIEKNDPLDAAPLAKTKLISKAGLLGSQVGPTAVITQTFPGKLRIRDIALEDKL